MFRDLHVISSQLVLIPTIFDYDEYTRASLAEQQNMTFYYNKAFGLRTWAANQDDGSKELAPFYGKLYGEGQGMRSQFVKVIHGLPIG